jgi:hypothetical protein
MERRLEGTKMKNSEVKEFGVQSRQDILRQSMLQILTSRVCSSIVSRSSALFVVLITPISHISTKCISATKQHTTATHYKH